MVAIQEISKKYRKLEVLKDISLEFNEPGIIGILGPNGSGKTTLLKTILGMVLPDNGTIRVNGIDISKDYNYRNEIAYLPQIATFPENLSVKELLAIIRDLRAVDSKYMELVSLFGLEQFLSEKLGNLSGGTRQKVNVVLSFMCKSEILILDEPTVGLDPVSTVKLKELIKSHRDMGKLILLTTHIMGIVDELADEIVYLLEGRMVYRGFVTDLKLSTQQDSLERAIVNEIHGKDVVDLQI